MRYTSNHNAGCGPDGSPNAATAEHAGTDAARIALAVGPLLYHWPRQTLMDFYAGLAESAADTIVLGEVVCSRRREMKPDDWFGLARDLAAEGKEVVLATQALIESEADLRLVRRLAEQGDFLVEAGDASALHRLAGKLPFVLGPHINIYSREALVEHAAIGAQRWAAPVELSIDAVALVNPPADPVRAADGAPIATEVFAFGRLPLAFSARCFTARHHRLNKDECEFRCMADADGMLLSSSEGQPFLVLNGTQTQSAATQCLIGEARSLRAAGVTRLRLSPSSNGFATVLAHFEQVMNHGADAADARREIESLAPDGGLCNGFAHRRPGMEQGLEAEAA
ncbi:MAG TPA: U32 family peptidase [Burkholderiaceae bacterium]|nr:U32 family peptidase [Burkholderiaceae bacterium]